MEDRLGELTSVEDLGELEERNQSLCGSSFFHIVFTRRWQGTVYGVLWTSLCTIFDPQCCTRASPENDRISASQTVRITVSRVYSVVVV
jgi:hypothetical protein